MAATNYFKSSFNSWSVFNKSKRTIWLVVQILLTKAAKAMTRPLHTVDHRFMIITIFISCLPCFTSLHPHGLICAPRRHPCGPQWGEEYEGAENHPVWFWRFLQRPLHYSERRQGQVFLHLCVLEVALQQDPGHWLWRCLVTARLTSVKKDLSWCIPI